jgi:hypothetical protein
MSRFSSDPDAQFGVELGGPWTCQDISLAIYAEVQHYKLAKSNLVEAGTTLGDAFQSWVEATGVEKTYMELALVGSAANFENAAVMEFDSRIRLGVAATLYGTYGCWNNYHGNWNAGYSPASTGGVTWSCSTELGWISFDDGEHWWIAEVTTCVYTA